MSVAVVEPVPDPLRRVLRRAVRELAGRERRRRFPPRLHIGVPGGSTRTFEPRDDPLDRALRIDVVEAMVRSGINHLGTVPGPRLIWLTRPGPLRLEDVDLEWLSATRAACGELEIAAHFLVVCRQAWVDPASGVGRAWRRTPRDRS